MGPVVLPAPTSILPHLQQAHRVVAFTAHAQERALFSQIWMVWLFLPDRLYQAAMGRARDRARECKLPIAACHCVGRRERHRRRHGATMKVPTIFSRTHGYACQHRLLAATGHLPKAVLVHRQLLRSLPEKPAHSLRDRRQQRQRRSWDPSPWGRQDDTRRRSAQRRADWECALAASLAVEALKVIPRRAPQHLVCLRRLYVDVGGALCLHQSQRTRLRSQLRCRVVGTHPIMPLEACAVPGLLGTGGKSLGQLLPSRRRAHHLPMGPRRPRKPAMERRRLSLHRCP
mmetsp:Transcript_55802/g.86666  ORF Transcript_55802/g.86666 Transcript_55802/m.86666 type:complete len:287 (+) Transcript_55802:494-1354(+)